MRVLLPALSVCFVLLYGCSGKQQTPQQVKRPVKIAKVEAVSALSKTYSGLVTADQYSNLTFKVGGTINAMHVSEGRNMKKGEVIAELDIRDFALQLEAARVAYMTSKSILERNERLLEKKAISMQEFEIAKAEFTNSKAKFENAKNMLSDTRLTAPFSGFIEKKFVENYQKVQAGEPVVKLVNPELINVRFTLPETGVDQIRNENTIEVAFEAVKGKKFNARIKEVVGASPDGSGIPVTLVIDDEKFEEHKNLVSAGFSCSVTITRPGKAGEKPVLVIPVASMFGNIQAEGQSVWLFDKGTGTIVRRNVEVGQLVSNDKVEVLAGLAEGDLIVAAGVNNIYEGQPVTILEN